MEQLITQYLERTDESGPGHSCIKTACIGHNNGSSKGNNVQLLLFTGIQMASGKECH